MGKDKPDLIASHGQTISHISGTSTMQVGNPKYLHNAYNKPVIYNFRLKDIELGGKGAPLIPFLDWLLFNKYKQNILTLNLGGIANISYIPKSGNREHVIGFDTGPGMSLIDEYSKKHFNQIALSQHRR